MHTDEAIASGLLERDVEVERLRQVLDRAAEGQAALVVAAAPAGMGKTKLLEAAIEDSAAVGARALIARASELERDFAFGIVRQLLEGPVLGVDEEQRASLLSGAARHAAAALDLDPQAGADRDLHATLHGLYWLLANLSAEAPLLVAVDDLQWADEPSVRWLAYCARRLEGLPIALMATARTDPENGRVELAAEASELRRAATDELLAAAVRLDPAPLSVTAVAGVLAAQLGGDVDAAFAAACHRQTGGNPFLLSELAAELAAERVSPTSRAIPEVERIVPERVGETIRRHLDRLGPDARELSKSVAVLGESGELAVAAELASMDLARATTAAAELVDAQILADAPELRFRHPLLRTAVENEIPAVELAGGHGRAAQLLAERGAPAGLIASHLLASPSGSGQSWAVEKLREAARSARAQGVPEQAAALLRRALAEPPAVEARGAVLRDLGEAELTFLDAGAAVHLAEARELTTDPRERAELAEGLGLFHYHDAAHAAGLEIVLEAIEEAREAGLREEWLRLEGLLAQIGRYDLQTEELTRGRARELAKTLTGDSRAERFLLAIAEAEDPGPSADDLYRITLAGAHTLEDTPWLDPANGIGTVAMYLHAGRPDAAGEFAELVVDTAREEGSPVSHALGVIARAMVEVEIGDLRAADSEFATALQALRDLGDHEMGRKSAGLRSLALAGLGRYEEADAVLAEYELDGDLPSLIFYNPTIHARGALRLAQRRFDEALADFRELGRRHALWQINRASPAWRSGAAHALIGLGRVEEARELALEELELARVWDTPKALALAGRALALTASGAEAIAGLAESVALLEDTPWRLERARARCDLGAALRRAGRRRESREALTVAMDEAHACGAEPLVELAAQELRASGARPRRRALSGLEALTPSEQRVAELAAAGRTNREIAQELFVTMATVETHLTRVYRKLDLEGRSGLAGALAVEG